MCLCSLMMILGACNHEEVPTYYDVDRVYFAFAEKAGSQDFSEDYMSISMGYDIPLKDDSLVSVPIKIIGKTAAEDREVKVELVDEESTAIENEDIEILKAVIPANSVVGKVWLKLNRTEKIMNQNLTARLRLVGNQNFHTDYTNVFSDKNGNSKNALIYTVHFTGIADAPSLWVASASQGQMNGVFGAYSREKLAVICEACGLTRDYFMCEEGDPTGKATIQKRFPMDITFGLCSMINRYLDNWLSTYGEPRRDENGEIIKITYTWR